MDLRIELLRVETVGDYLVSRGVLGRGVPITAKELGGGVSNIVLAVCAGPDRLVVKQALPRLRVTDDWFAKQERAITEAEALRVAGRLEPGSVPVVLDMDPKACALTIQHAPAGWRNWKELLLRGDAEDAVARRLGEVLGAWHRGSYGDPVIAARFDDFEAFEQLRVDPYLRTVSRRLPELAPAIAPYIERLSTARRCLVHGDYSPKNVLVGADSLWVVDFEVAHFGNPEFDLAFMLNHLMLKAIHRPTAAAGYLRCAAAFWEAYLARVQAELWPDGRAVFGCVGCLMVARVDGKSPAEYLTGSERRVARSVGRGLLLDPPDGPASAWQQLALVADA